MNLKYKVWVSGKDSIPIRNGLGFCRWKNYFAVCYNVFGSVLIGRNKKIGLKNMFLENLWF